MMSVAVTGWISVVYFIGFIAIAALPIWFGAQITGAARPTLLRSMSALIAGTVGSVLGIFCGFPLALLIAPLAFLFAFKLILDMSFTGALMLCIISVFGGVLMLKFIASREINEDTKTSLIIPVSGIACEHPNTLIFPAVLIT